jgi:hypothetical protein
MSHRGKKKQKIILSRDKLSHQERACGRDPTPKVPERSQSNS